MSICTARSWFEVLVAVFALGAAGWWFAASWIARARYGVCSADLPPLMKYKKAAASAHDAFAQQIGRIIP
jgi:hypothetical protein